MSHMLGLIVMWWARISSTAAATRLTKSHRRNMHSS